MPKIKDNYPVTPELCHEPDWAAEGMDDPEPCLIERPCPKHDPWKWVPCSCDDEGCTRCLGAGEIQVPFIP